MPAIARVASASPHWGTRLDIAYTDAIGWLVLLLVMGVGVTALAKRTLPRWRR